MEITLREFIIQSFNYSELATLCESDEQLAKAVKEYLSENVGLGENVNRLVDFCRRRGLLNLLRQKVKEALPEKWLDYQMPDKEPEARDEARDEVNDVFRKIKAMETMDAQIAEVNIPRDGNHPLTKSDSELKKWFSEELNTDEQVFFLTSVLFSGLEKHEFLKIYDGINHELQASDEQSEEN